MTGRKRVPRAYDITSDPDYETAFGAINDFFSNTDRARSQTREGLLELRGEIDSLLEALAEDDRRLGEDS